MKSFHTLLLLIIVSKIAYAQDSISITLPQADSLLLARNLSLIAAHYDVDMADAAKVQAKLFNNPQLSTEWNLYNPAKQKYFDVGQQGQKIIALEQVFRIAGQRNASVRLAEEQKKMSDFQYYDVARTLRYELHTSFFRYYSLSRATHNIQSQLRLLKNLIDVYQQQYQKGNISLQELTRLNTTYFSINSQVTQIQAEQLTLQQTLKILLSENAAIIPVIPNPEIPALPELSLPVLQQLALSNRPDLKSVESFQAQSKLQLSLEKKSAVPDLVAGAVYDQAGSYVNNYSALTLGFQIPIFNRNQGRIKAAQYQIQQSNTLVQSKQQSIALEVETALKTFRLQQQQYNNIGQNFEQELDLLSEGLVSNYSKSNISLLEFTDMFESYNANIIQYNQLRADLNKSYEELNYVVGQDLQTN